MKKTLTLKECLADFISHHKRNVDLMNFAKVAPNTERNWRVDRTEPSGEIRVKVRHFLEIIGYKIDEIDSLDDPVYKVSQCLAFEIVTLDYLMNTFSFLKSTHVFNYLLGRRGMGSTETEFIRIANEHEDARLRKLDELKKMYQSYITGVKDQKDQLVPTPKSEYKGDLIADFREACKRTRELGQKLLTGTVEQRFNMRFTMTTTNNPELHLTWEVLNNLLKEERK